MWQCSSAYSAIPRPYRTYVRIVQSRRPGSGSSRPGGRDDGQNPGMTIELVPLCTATLTLADPIMIPDTPGGHAGHRRGRRRGTSKVSGCAPTSTAQAAADWLTVNAALLGTIDVRALLETDDGALIYTWYHGRLDLSQGTGASPAYSAPLYETGDERYAWLNKIQAVAKGIVSADGKQLVYEICEVR